MVAPRAVQAQQARAGSSVPTASRITFPCRPLWAAVSGSRREIGEARRGERAGCTGVDTRWARLQRPAPIVFAGGLRLAGPQGVMLKVPPRLARLRAGQDSTQ